MADLLLLKEDLLALKSEAESLAREVATRRESLTEMIANLTQGWRLENAELLADYQRIGDGHDSRLRKNSDLATR